MSLFVLLARGPRSVDYRPDCVHLCRVSTVYLSPVIPFIFVITMPSQEFDAVFSLPCVAFSSSHCSRFFVSFVLFFLIYSNYLS